jgi:hypothetical protein
MDSSGLATDFSVAFFPKLFKPTTILMCLDIAPNLGFLGHKTHDVIKKNFGTLGPNTCLYFGSPPCLQCQIASWIGPIPAPRGSIGLPSPLCST